jgi:putative membrane protein
MLEGAASRKRVDWGLPISKVGGRMGLIITLIVFVGLAAIIVWIADWTSGGERRSTALDTLNQRLARGEIDRAEYEEKRKLIGR